MLRGWKHSGCNVHRTRRVLPGEREDPRGYSMSTALKKRFWKDLFAVPSTSGSGP